MSKHTLARGFANIPIRDLPIWESVFNKDGITSPEEIQKELTLIDDLLALQKNRSLLKRNRRLDDLLEDRIKEELELNRIYQAAYKTKRK